MDVSHQSTSTLRRKNCVTFIVGRDLGSEPVGMISFVLGFRVGVVDGGGLKKPVN
jgi:hypothetical protein